ncbi:MAG: FMN-binding negative transcriptional regulator [Propionibacteriaceae bacterium]|nr:FMN-binding negative transcriptional regulator [Propionibacteriaceae bacterium]
MYIPNHFRMNDAEASAFLEHCRVADLVASTPGGLEASFLPLHYSNVAGKGSLSTHIAKINPLAQLDQAPAVAILHGADAFIRAAWLLDADNPSPAASWNYLVLHAYGTLHIHNDPDWITEQVMTHSVALEPDFDPSSFSQELLAKLLPAMVGLELQIERVEAKAKMSQNKTPAQIQRIIAGLREAGCPQVADWMEAVSLPRSQDKAEMLADIRRAHAD